MIRKLLISIFPIAALAILTGGQMNENGRAGKTGSPGESTCMGCHNDYTLNSGGGSITIQSPGMTAFQYTPGQTYNMSVTVSRSANNLFGVGIEALMTTNNNAGTLNITDAASTQIKNATVNTVSRHNIVHQFNGGASAGSKIFNFSWTAPVAGTGDVTFYFAGIAANSDGNESGDYVYSSSQLFTESTCATPSQPGAISGNTSVCSGTSAGYSIAAVAGATSYTWTLPSGWTGTSTTTSISAVSGNTSGTITVTADNTCGSSPVSSLTVSSNLVSAMQSTVNVSCYGGTNGSATVTPSGGTPMYTFSWSPSGGNSATASNLAQGTYTVTITDSRGCTNATLVNITQPPALTATPNQTNAYCNGDSTGTAAVIASGGTPSYQYTWTPYGGSASSANNLVAGNYSVTVTDINLCTNTFSFVITQPPLINIITSTTDITCGLTNGTATANATGGTGTLTYSWTTVPVQTTATATNLGAGSYTVTVTDSAGCIKTATDTVNQPSTLSATSSFTGVSCNGDANGIAIVNANGGMPGYTYSWTTIPVQNSDTAFNLSAGTYTATVTDSIGCSYSTSVTITEPDLLVATAGTDTTICVETGIILGGIPAATGGTSSYTYSWSPSTGLSSPTDSNPVATPLNSTVYTLTVTDSHNCTDVSLVRVTVNPLPVPVITSNNDTLITMHGTFFKWYLDGIFISNSTRPKFLATHNGNYMVIVTDSNGCSDTSAILSFTTLGINSADGNDLLTLFPNPASGRLSFHATEMLKNSPLLIYDISGNIIRRLILQCGDNIIDLTGVAKGVYTAVAENKNKKVVLRFIISD